ncbi:MAG: undecaprenyl diphosphate synthase family protein [Holosporales bacterium]|jgi:undecaprenyl diphosphate synthase|nr:undecaprenyl diphosphate synthase family protein [Holosporales bacterium]
MSQYDAMDAIVRDSAMNLSATKKVEPIPIQHVAFIPDGNTRWARARGLPSLDGYKAGIRVVEEMATYATEIGIKYLTFYLLSLENVRQRSGLWLDSFFAFALAAIGNFSERIKAHGCKIRIIGNTSYLPDALQRALAQLVDETKDNPGIVLVFAVAYSGRDEILRATNTLFRKRVTELFCASNSTQQITQATATTSQESFTERSNSEFQHITLDEFHEHLDLNGIPAPDLLIRSANELRLSGFLLWHLDYTEFAFPSEFWPDFSVDSFVQILDDYRRRPRNFGKERA